jgi:hypothetical protein
MKYLVFTLSLLSLSACNLNQNIAIRGLDLSSTDSSGATYVNLEAIVSLGSLKLPNTNSPIHSVNQDIGNVSIENLADGTSRVAVTVNYDEAMKADPTLGKTLPNSRDIPALLANDTSLIGIPILQNSRVYVGGNPRGKLYAGIALNVPAFDHILSQIPLPLNLFLPFPFSNEIFGVAGIYSSKQVGQNGLAIFAKYSAPTSSTLASPSAVQATEIEKVDNITLIRLNYLFTKHAILRIK